MPHLLSPFAVSLPTVLAVCLASLVEFIEALTIVLAVAVVSGWRNAIAGSITGVVVLAGIIGIAGPLLMKVDLNPLRIIAGAALLIFGLRWLRKGILRAAGKLPLHDEDKAFAKEVGVLQSHEKKMVAGFDIGAAGTAFNGVLIEGLEVAFIVVAAGVTAGKALLAAASLGAAIALGSRRFHGCVLLRRPITAIPENTLKLAVAVMVSGLGVYWFGEGIGAHWPGGLWASLALSSAFIVFAAVMVSLLKSRPTAEPGN